MTHGFLTPSGGVGSTQNDKVEHAVGFIRDSLSSYARSALPFVGDSHLAVEQLISSASSTPGDHVADVVQSLHALDNLYDTTTLNHIARRASQTQGVALLSLYSKGFTRPAVHRRDDIPSPNVDAHIVASTLVDRLKLDVRREDTPGHLPICWGLLTAALGLSLGAATLLYWLASGNLPVSLHPCAPSRTQPVLTSLPVRPWRPVRWRANERHRTVCLATTLAAYYSPSGRCGSREVRQATDWHNARRRWNCAIRRSHPERKRTCDDMAIGRNPRCSARPAALQNIQQLTGVGGRRLPNFPG